ncbi:hypothetical protein QNI16_15505 [Cytophagaceae bacterium YF14B1]|uniref:Uncharacterized protein n=1 Tax=Xanthocytophaga flava TaxID=3048013 RepID=A0AAE3U709_9BACT|nr:hypothetical protein [Xanthocytophaga flavus]MDJ1481906.1 hypothetical protein [Xanthocytophaga flavus]
MAAQSNAESEEEFRSEVKQTKKHLANPPVSVIRLLTGIIARMEAEANRLHEHPYLQSEENASDSPTDSLLPLTMLEWTVYKDLNAVIATHKGIITICTNTLTSILADHTYKREEVIELFHEFEQAINLEPDFLNEAKKKMFTREIRIDMLRRVLCTVKLDNETWYKVYRDLPDLIEGSL